MSWFTNISWLVLTLASFVAYSDERYFLAGMFLFQILISVLGDIADAIKESKK